MYSVALLSSVAQYIFLLVKDDRDMRSTLTAPVTIEEHPFVISSTTDIPFLAKATLTSSEYADGSRTLC
jgi:hypothetical protein